ncbi:MAG TPA: transglycosylase domain-containing protein [Vicinamibacteria bacterium]|nr:transglycosylase domain-containing protein [Vicinamibacteria bacterium]
MTPQASVEPSRPLFVESLDAKVVRGIFTLGLLSVAAHRAAQRLRRSGVALPGPAVEALHRAAARLRSMTGGRAVRVGAAAAAVGLMVTAAAAHQLYLDRPSLPDLEPFIRFQPPTTGEVYDARGQVLIELAREYRRIVSYAEVPPVVRESILAAEDKNFFSHGGIDYATLPRVVWKTLATSASATWRHSTRDRRLAAAVVFPQGGSTLTQQLVRGYFLRHLTSQEEGATLIGSGLAAHAAARVLGVPATNKLLRKAEEIRLSLWLEQEMARRYGSKRRAKEEILARYASFIYMGNGRYGFAAASEYYYAKPLPSYGPEDADKAALLAGITKSPRDYAPSRGNLDRPRRRRNDILRLMVRNGALSPEAGRAAEQAPIRLAPRRNVKTEAPAVVENVFGELKAARRDGVSIDALFDGRITVHTTVDNRIQLVVNEALEAGLRAYEERHPKGRGQVQGSVVVLRNSDAAVLAEAGGRQVYKDRYTSYSDYNRVTHSRRQPGSVMKPIVYLAALQHGAALDAQVADAPIAVPTGLNQPPKWIRNYDGRFKGLIPVRLALAESRNAATIRLASQVGIREVIRTAHELGIRTPLQPYITTALGASEVQLLELANAYRALASGLGAEPHVIARVVDPGGAVVFAPPAGGRPLPFALEALSAIQEGLRGVVRLPTGTAHSLAAREFGIPVMGKTGTSSDFRDALFVGSTYGPEGITVAVRIGYDDNRELGEKETGGRAALPIFRDVVSAVYARELAGPPPSFPAEMEQRIDEYVAYAVAIPEEWPGESMDLHRLEAAPLVMPARLLSVEAPAAVAPAAPMFETPSEDDGRERARRDRRRPRGRDRH